MIHFCEKKILIWFMSCNINLRIGINYFSNHNKFKFGNEIGSLHPGKGGLISESFFALIISSKKCAKPLPSTFLDWKSKNWEQISLQSQKKLYCSFFCLNCSVWSYLAIMEMDSKFSAAVPGPLEYMGWLEFVPTNLYLK